MTSGILRYLNHVMGSSFNYGERGIFLGNLMSQTKRLVPLNCREMRQEMKKPEDIVPARPFFWSGRIAGPEDFSNVQNARVSMD